MCATQLTNAADRCMVCDGGVDSVLELLMHFGFKTAHVTCLGHDTQLDQTGLSTDCYVHLFMGYNTQIKKFLYARLEILLFSLLFCAGTNR